MRAKIIRSAVVGLFAVVAGITVVGASPHRRGGDDDDERHHRHEHRSRGDRGRARAAEPIDPTYAKECGACHVPYPSGLLPAASWRALLGGLADHFGEDAELEPGDRDRLEGWLVDRAGPDSRAGAPAPLRITELPWFRREHDEVPRDAAARPSIRTMANCAACHPRAAAWDFDDDGVKIPRG